MGGASLLLLTGTGTGPSPAEPPFAVPTGPVRNVLSLAEQASAQWQIRAADPGKAGTTRHRVLVDVQDPVFTWVVRRQRLGGPPTGTGVFRARISGGSLTTPVDVAFAGNPVAGIPADGGQVSCDPVPVRLRAGDAIDILTWVDADTDGNLVSSNTPPVPGYDPGGAAGTWEQAAAAVPAHPGTGALRPSGLWAPSDRASWVLCGDSIAAEANSYLVQAARNHGFASVLAAMGGEGFYHYPAPGTTGWPPPCSTPTRSCPSTRSTTWAPA
ncbi:hypothetical protein [Sinomonas sp. ASV322]|uniref:hypothetical protein n=1 Tax=Sinomonas sp. ASV322 TaxID=3041920 RepID=UPI0027DC96D8|nr:hypothetical protein [Sinomonas sp. ASV322]MDQ4502195.1 hypothetical protein [Sinomonas sp. ASV322]